MRICATSCSSYAEEKTGIWVEDVRFDRQSKSNPLYPSSPGLLEELGIYDDGTGLGI